MREDWSFKIKISPQDVVQMDGKSDQITKSREHLENQINLRKS